MMKPLFTKPFLKVWLFALPAMMGCFSPLFSQTVVYSDLFSLTNTVSPPQTVLVGFNAIINDHKVDLTWTTPNEKKTDYFAVERSRDGITFEIFAMTKGAGNSMMPIDYAEVDYSPYPGMSYYRMKEIDHDGQVSYSPIVAVNYHFEKAHGITVSPNPNEGEFEIDLSQAISEEVLVVIRDITGKEVFSKVMLKKEGKSLVVVDSENKLSTGVYIVMASSRNELYSQKIIVR